jgi:hypothetical protein
MSLLLALTGTVAGAFTLTCEGASLLLDGKNVNLKVDRSLTAETQSYAVTSNNVNLTVNRILTAEPFQDTPLFSDDFTGTAGTLGSNYTQQGDGLVQRNGLGKVIGTLSANRNVAWPNTVTFAAKQYAEITLSTLGTGANTANGVMLRLQTGESPTVEKGYAFRTDPGASELPPYRYVISEFNATSSNVVIASSSVVPAPNDRVRGVAINDKLLFYVNNQLILTVQNTSYPSGVPAIYSFGNVWSSDDFVAGNYGGLHLAGTYTTVKAARKLVADTQSYALTGNDATLTKTASNSLTAESQSYALTGNDATLTKTGSNSLTAESQSYALTSNNVNLTVNRSLTAKTLGVRLETNIVAPVFSDDFNRANATTLGANWNTTQGSFAISSNKVYGNITDYNAFATPTATFNSDQAAKITISGDFSDAGDHIGIGVRLSAGVAADYRTWTELDPTSVLSKVSETVTITSMNALSGTGIHGVWYDGGTNWKAGDFWSSVGAVTITATGSDNSRFIVAALTDNNTSGASSGNENRPSIQVRWIKTATSQRLELAQFRSTDTSTASPAVSDFYEGSAVALNTPFYIELERVGSTANCRIYSNASHTTLVDTLTITLTEIVSMRYYYVAGKSSTGSAAVVSGTIGPTNFDVPQTGYVFRTDGFPSGNRTLLRLSYGNFVTIGAPILPIIGGETIELRAVGSVLSLYINDILKYKTTDTLYTSGKPGILYIWSNTRDVFLDDFYSWNILPSVDLRINRTLTAESQSYAFTGNNVTLTKTASNSLTAESQSYALTSNNVNLSVNRTLAATTQSYAVTSNNVNLVVAKILLATVQTYVIASTGINFFRGLRVGVTAQAFTLTGPPINLTRGEVLVADTRSYTLTRNDANLLQAHRLVADVRSYTLNTSVTNLVYTTVGSFALAATSRSYTLTRNDANLLQAHRLVADVRSYTLTRNDANLNRGEVLVADTRSYTLTRNDANLLQAHRLVADVRSYTLTRNDANLNRGEVLVADTRSYTLTRNDATLFRGKILVASTRSYTLTRNDALISRGGFVKVWTGSAWVSKPLKVWNGTAWVSKPLKVWTGSIWRTY